MWKNFFNKPKLWLLTALGIFLIGVIINLTPGMVTMSSSSILGDYKTSGQEMDTGKTLGEFVLHSISNYPLISGASLYQGSSSANIRYNIIMSVILTGLMFLGIIILTRKRNNAIFALGPLAVYFVVSLILLAISFSGSGAKINLFLTMWNWLILFGAISISAMLTAKFLTKVGLVKGIDQAGVALDFTKLQNVVTIIVQETAKLAVAGGTTVTKFIEKSVTTLDSNTISTVPNKATTCPACGGVIKNGKCTTCLSEMKKFSLNKTVCHKCNNPKAVDGKFCWSCGVIFTPTDDETRSSTDYITQPPQFCSNCGKPVNMTDKYCGTCGTAVKATPELKPKLDF